MLLVHSPCEPLNGVHEIGGTPEWENVFSTSAMTVAAVDRLVDHSTIIQINGESYRRKRARRLAP